METDHIKEKKTCAQCDRVLHGRSDQRFCNDDCRNTFNRHKRAEEKSFQHKHVQAIIGVIKKNYEILWKLYPGPMPWGRTGMPNLELLLSLGFNPRFYTSSFIDDYGNTWRCVFDRCFCEAETRFEIRDFPRQAELE